MISDIKFIMNAVSISAQNQAYRHFKLSDGRIYSTDGIVTMSSPISIDISCNPRADQFLKAMESCSENKTVWLESNGKVCVKNRRSKAYVDCFEGDIPIIAPQGEKILSDEHFIDILKKLYPLIGTDENRIWSNGILFDGASAIVTNNVIIAKHDIGFDFKNKVSIHRDCIKKIIKANCTIESIQCSNNSVTFNCADDRWIKCQTLPSDWPDVENILSQTYSPVNLNKSIFDAIDFLLPFSKDGKLFIEENCVKTSNVINDGASFIIDGLNGKGIYQIHMFSLLKNIAENIDLTSWPKPCLFDSKNLKGAIIGFPS